MDTKCIQTGNKNTGDFEERCWRLGCVFICIRNLLKQQFEFSSTDDVRTFSKEWESVAAKYSTWTPDKQIHTGTISIIGAGAVIAGFIEQCLPVSLKKLWKSLLTFNLPNVRGFKFRGPVCQQFVNLCRKIKPFKSWKTVIPYIEEQSIIMWGRTAVLFLCDWNK